MIRIDTDVHPSANYVQQKGLNFKKYLAYGNRDKVAQDLKLGDMVESHSLIETLCYSIVNQVYTN